MFDPIAALVVAAAIVFAGLRILTGSSRVLVDEAPPAEELDRIEAAIAGGPPAGDGRLPQAARPPRRGAARYIDLHVQFRSGTTLEDAHALAHRLRAAIEAEIPDSEVLIHVEPEGAVRDPGSRDAAPYPGRLRARRRAGQMRLTAADRPTAPSDDRSSPCSRRAPGSGPRSRRRSRR